MFKNELAGDGDWTLKSSIWFGEVRVFSEMYFYIVNMTVAVLT